MTTFLKRPIYWTFGEVGVGTRVKQVFNYRKPTFWLLIMLVVVCIGLILTVMLAFAEFERDMIVERTQEGREIARQNPNYRDGRKKKYTPQQMEHALAMLKKFYST